MDKISGAKGSPHGRVTVFFFGLLLCLAAFAVQAASPPLVLYTDILSGPTSGGENNQGVYLSIFGKNFGSSLNGVSVQIGNASIGWVAVNNYRYLGPSKGRSDIQQLSVQVGALAGLNPGTTYGIKVIVNNVASNTNVGFMPNPGRILFVDNVTGNDATAVAGDITRPWRYLQQQSTTTTATGAWGQVQPGDVIVMRGNSVSHPAPRWTDTGFIDSGSPYFAKLAGLGGGSRSITGTPPTGQLGTGPIAIIAYPGEDVFIDHSASTDALYGVITGANTDSYPGQSQWITLANLRVWGGQHDGPINLNVSGPNWRVVNNDLSAPNAPNTSRSGGITGNGMNAFIVGNSSHDVSGDTQTNHGIYLDRPGNYEVAYNVIYNITGGNGIQFYNAWTASTDYANVHHNIIHDVAKHGINIADGSKNGFQILNNIIYNAQGAGIRFNTTQLQGCKVWNNTFYNNHLDGLANGEFENSWNLPAGSLDIQNNIIYAHGTSLRYFGGSVGWSSPVWTATNNLFYNGMAGTEIGSNQIKANPLFARTAVDPGLPPDVQIDLHPRAGSPAIDAGSPGVSALVVNDYNFISRAQGAGYDIGAYEYTSSCQTATVGGPWQNSAFTAQSNTTFRAEFDATPSASSNSNSVIGLSLNPQTTYSGFAALVRFNPTGSIDACNGSCNGGTYQGATPPITYSAGQKYHFRLEVNLSGHTYSIFVTPPGGSEQTLGQNFAFRSDQSQLSSMNNWGLIVDPSGTGSVTVCGFTINGAPQ